MRIVLFKLSTYFKGGAVHYFQIIFVTLTSRGTAQIFEYISTVPLDVSVTKINYT